MFEKVTILGVGLLGASFALALKKFRLCSHVTGYGRDNRNLLQARERGILDSFADDPASACEGADLVLCSTPVGNFLDLIRRAAPSFKKGMIVTDVGSVKGRLVYEMEKIMPEGVPYIGSHPIAGSDRSGIGPATPDLFSSAQCIVTPTRDSDPEALETVSRMWESIGASVIRMSPERHDRVYAAVSHLPHLIAFALMNSVMEIDRESLDFAGQGFRDSTRIAASSAGMWSDICIMNRENLLEMIPVFQRNLDLLGSYLRASDPASLEQEFVKARTARKTIG